MKIWNTLNNNTIQPQLKLQMVLPRACSPPISANQSIRAKFWYLSPPQLLYRRRGLGWVSLSWEDRQQWRPRKFRRTEIGSHFELAASSRGPRGRDEMNAVVRRRLARPRHLLPTNAAMFTKTKVTCTQRITYNVTLTV